MQFFRRLSLRSVLIGINLVVLALPVAGIQLMRLYESALVRQTESALIAQAAFVAAFYRSLVVEQGTQNWRDMTRTVELQNTRWADGQWLPQPPTLDLTTSPTLGSFPDGLSIQAAEPFAHKVGNRLMPVLKDAQLVTLAGIRVVDPWGVIVASTGDDVGLSIAHGEEMAQALAGRPASRLRRKNEIATVDTLDGISRNSSIRVFVASPILLHGRLAGAVMLSRTPTSIVQALYGKRWLLLQGFALLVGLVLVMSLVTFRLIARPISRLADQAESITSGAATALQTQVQGATTALRTLEIGRLEDSIATMATTLEQRANYLQDFSRHVSHEFKTPIASIRGTIEVLQDHAADMSDEQHERFLKNIEADAKRLHRLTERLMELTRAEIQSAEPIAFSLSPIVHEIGDAFQAAVRVDSSGVNPKTQVMGDPEVIRAVLEILFENAQQHDATHIRVWTTTDKLTNLTIQDDGIGISASNRTRIFEPFFTTGREHGGTGLGLTIAEALLHQINGSIGLDPDAGATTFVITLAPGN